MAPPSLLHRFGFVGECGKRLRRHWAIKLIGLTLGMAAFFAAYFGILNNPIFPVTVMPLTVVDRFIGFHPAALPLYVSLWIYVPLTFVLLDERRELLACGLAAATLSVSGLLIFLYCPTAVPILEVDWSMYPSFVFLKSVDAAGNACPSLHVAFAVFTAVRLGPLLKDLGAGPLLRACNWLWCVGIVYSTIATGQHVALDVMAGAVLGLAVAGGAVCIQALRRRTEPVNCSVVGTTHR